MSKGMNRELYYGCKNAKKSWCNLHIGLNPALCGDWSYLAESCYCVCRLAQKHYMSCRVKLQQSVPFGAKNSTRAQFTQQALKAFGKQLTTVQGGATGSSALHTVGTLRHYSGGGTCHYCSQSSASQTKKEVAASPCLVLLLMRLACTAAHSTLQHECNDLLSLVLSIRASLLGRGSLGWGVDP